MPTGVGHYAWGDPHNREWNLCWGCGVEVIHGLYKGSTWECGVWALGAHCGHFHDKYVVQGLNDNFDEYHQIASQ